MKNLDIALKNLNIYPCLPRRIDASAYWMGDHCYKEPIMYYVLDGAFVLNVDSNNYIVQKHQMALLPANHPHTYWRIPNQPLSFLVFGARVECHDEDFFEFFGLNDGHHVVNLPAESVLECYRQMHTPDGANDNFSRRLNLCLHLGRMCLLYAQARISAENAKHEFADVIEYMQTHITEDLSLTELSKCFHFDHTYFVKKFKKQMGISPMKYFARMRAKYAANLLKTTEMTISEIAAATGFSDVYYFKTFFVRHMGVRPEQYRDILTRPKELRSDKL